MEQEERRKAKERYTVTQFGNSPECPDLETPNEAGATNEILATKAGEIFGVSKEKAIPNLDEPLLSVTTNEILATKAGARTDLSAEMHESLEGTENFQGLSEHSESVKSYTVTQIWGRVTDRVCRNAPTGRIMQDERTKFGTIVVLIKQKKNA